MTVTLIAVGLGIGLLVGLTGVGGGSLMTPALIFFGLDPLVAVGTDLLYSVPTKIFGTVVHARQRTIDLSLVVLLCIGGLPAAIVGIALLAIAAQHVPPAVLEGWMRKAVGGMIVLAAIAIAASPFLLKYRERESQPERLPRRRIIAVGALVGFVVSLTSIGAGSIALPLLVLCLPSVSLAVLVGSDIAFAAVLVVVSSAGHWSLGHVNLSVTVQLLLGSLVGVYVGSKLCRLLQQAWLRPAIALTLAFAGTRLL